MADTVQYFDILPRSQAIPYVVAFIIEFLVIITGNAVVAAVFSRTRQLRQRKCYWPTISLAVADLLVGALGGPLSLYSFNSNLWEWKYQVLLIVNAVFHFVSYASLTNLMVVALERAYATLWPLKHRVLSTRTYHVMMAVGWILPIFFPSLDLAERRGFVSALVFKFVWIACNWFLLTIILLCYISIWIKIKFYQHPQNHVTTAQERKLTASLFLATAVSIVTWLPAVVLSTAFYLPSLARELPNYGFYHLYNCVSLLLFANSFVNPIIYSFRMPQFRRAASRLLCRRTNERQVQAIEMRNRPEGVNRQACAVICYRPEPNMGGRQLVFYHEALNDNLFETTHCRRLHSW